MISKKEDLECEKLTTWLRLQNYRFNHAANETGIGGFVGVKIGARNKKIGVSKGFPDYEIFLKNGDTLYLEMKLPKKILTSGKVGQSPSKITQEQREWIDFLNSRIRTKAVFAFGFDDAKRIVENTEKYL